MDKTGKIYLQRYFYTIFYFKFRQNKYSSKLLDSKTFFIGRLKSGKITFDALNV